MSDEPKTECSEANKKIFEAIEKNDIILLKSLLVDQQDVNVVDENAMTPLQHAAYKGNKEIVQMLLDQGADVNHCEHQHNYTALHFAGLSGNVDVCLALLLSGAQSQVTNTVGRTPSQMAAFVGNHNCVATINNYIPKADVEFYTTSSGSSPPPLPPFLAESFHKFIMQVNIHPIKVILNLQNFVGLSDHLTNVQKVLASMSKKEMKKGSENNEVMSFKFHYLSYIVGELAKLKQQREAANSTGSLDTIELLARKLLKPGKEGQLEIMDAFIKECIREYSFRDCTLFSQIVNSFMMSEKDPPTALSVVASAINGQRGFVDNISICCTCGEEKPAKKCSKCKVVQYCDRNCQRLHWHWHKKACARLSQQGDGAADTKVAPDSADISADIQKMLLNS